MDRRGGRRRSGPAVLCALGMAGMLCATNVGAQEAPSLSENLLNASVSELLQAAADRDARSLQTYHLIRVARRLQAVVMESLNQAPGAVKFPGADVVVDLQDAVASFGSGGVVPLDPEVLQGIEELASWYDLASWSRAEAAGCAGDEEGSFLEQLEATGSWWSEEGRAAPARALGHALALFYERGGFGPGIANAERVPACMAEGSEVGVRLALTDYRPPTPLDLTATRSSIDPHRQVELTWIDTWTDLGIGPGELNVERSSDGGVNWVQLGSVPRPDGAFTVSALTPGTAYRFRLTHGEEPASDVADAATEEITNGRPTWIIPVIGAAALGVLLLTRDGDGDVRRNGTVIVRIPLG